MKALCQYYTIFGTPKFDYDICLIIVIFVTKLPIKSMPTVSRATYKFRVSATMLDNEPTP